MHSGVIWIYEIICLMAFALNKSPFIHISYISFCLLCRVILQVSLSLQDINSYVSAHVSVQFKCLVQCYSSSCRQYI